MADEHGAPHLVTTECPARSLERVPWAAELIAWWMQSSTWGDQSGQPIGPPEWPRTGGMLRQSARLLDAVAVLRAEWPHVQRARRTEPRKA